MVTASLRFKNSTIGYTVFGNGPLPVVCFHGYGENADTFRVLEEPAGSKYTFYAIDLPYHGKTTWNDGNELLLSDLKQIILLILPSHHTTGITFMGYSLGGRIVLSLYELLHAVTARLVLIAPDGLKVNPWYWIATQTKAGNGLFRFTMKDPKWFFAMLKGMNKAKLVNSSIFKFVNHQIGDKQVRIDLYNRWTTLRKFRPDLNNIKKLVRSDKTPVRLVYGEHDKMILPSRGKLFCNGIEEYCRLIVLDSGHQLLTKKHSGAIVEQLTT